MVAVLEGCKRVHDRLNSAEALDLLLAAEPAKPYCGKCAAPYSPKAKPFVLACGHHVCGSCKDDYEVEAAPCVRCGGVFEDGVTADAKFDKVLSTEALQYYAALNERREAARLAAEREAAERARAAEERREAERLAAEREAAELPRMALADSESHTAEAWCRAVAARPWLTLPPDDCEQCYVLFGPTRLGKSSTGCKLLGFDPFLWYAIGEGVAPGTPSPDQSALETGSPTPTDRVLGYPLEVSDKLVSKTSEVSVVRVICVEYG